MSKAIYFPSLRGVIGDWAYYSCLIPMKELSERVSFAEDLHQNSSLSDMIQRKLKDSRAEEISRYVQDQDERFFNSLVVAVYGGQPEWLSFGEIKPGHEDIDLSLVPEDSLQSLGFLSLNGEEKLFAIDGQHRLAGFKKLFSSGDRGDLESDDVSVLFVAHQNSADGLERTRRLFTTLNKTAKPVNKGEIIALDEDDAMAIIARQLVENYPGLSGKRIAFVATNNMPANNKHSLTTIGNLYDILKILFTKLDTPHKKGLKKLQFRRPRPDQLNEYYEFSIQYFDEMCEAFSEVKEYFYSKEEDLESLVPQYRGDNGGSVLYRPIGWSLFAEVLRVLSVQNDWKEAISQKLSKLPTDLSSPPYKWLMWNPNTKTISNSNKTLLRDVLLYMLNEDLKGTKIEDLKEKYLRVIGDQQSIKNLPEKVI